MRCDLKTIKMVEGKHLIQCSRCGRMIGPTDIPPERRRAQCLAPEDKDSRAVAYSKAVIKWIKSGFQKRSKKEVARIHEEICQPCEFFKDDSCSVCGCGVKKSGAALLNKIAMKTESCPKGKW